MLGLGVVLSLLAFSAARGWQRREAQNQAANLARHHTEKLQLSILRSLEVLHSIASLHEVEGGLRRETFQDFVQSALRRQPELQALSWNPLVAGAARAAFEREAVASGLEGFVVRESGGNRKLRAASEGTEHVPVYWIEPLRPNILALGFDLNSDPRRREFLLRARDSGQAVATCPVRLAQADSPGFLVLQPVYRGGAVPESVEARRAQLAGYAVAVFSVSSLVENVLGELSKLGLQAQLRDDSGRGEVIYGHAPSGRVATLEVQVAGRRWSLAYVPNANFVAPGSRSTPWLILLAGLAFTTLTTAHLYGGWRSSMEIEQANRALREEVIVRERAEQAAANANEAKSDFLASMSHEIRTPLNAMLGYAQLLQRDAHITSEQRDSLHGISVSGQHLLGLINEVLDLAKIEAGRVELNPGDFDLAMLARSLEMTFRPLCAQKRIQFHARVESGAATRVCGDEGKLRQVLINLVGNAVKFTRAGEVFLGIRPEPDERWLFEVVDTGLGIPAEERAHIFQPFHQGSGAQHQGGTGLGLAIAQRQVGLLGGELQLASERGAGSRFFFIVPLGAAQSVDAVEPAETTDAAEVLAPLDGLRVTLPEEVCARLAVAAELHSTTALKSALQELRQLGPSAELLADHIRHFMRSYDMDAIQRLLAAVVVPVSAKKPDR